jgi:arogenate dehydrogenase (NADP+), plant
MLDVLPEESDILCTHPMFGPESGKFGWQGLPFLYEKVRISDNERYREGMIFARHTM